MPKFKGGFFPSEAGKIYPIYSSGYNEMTNFLITPEIDFKFADYNFITRKGTLSYYEYREPKTTDLKEYFANSNLEIIYPARLN